MKELSLRKVEDNDIDMIYTWLHREHIRKWYGEPGDWLNELHERNGEYFYIKHFIVVLENEDIGFCQYYDCSKTGKGFEWDNEPAGTYAVDYMIADTNLIGKGFGKKVVELICSKVASTENVIQLIADPSKDNIPSIKTLLSLGFLYDNSTGLYKKQTAYKLNREPYCC